MLEKIRRRKDPNRQDFKAYGFNLESFWNWNILGVPFMLSPSHINPCSICITLCSSKPWLRSPRIIRSTSWMLCSGTAKVFYSNYSSKENFTITFIFQIVQITCPCPTVSKWQRGLSVFCLPLTLAYYLTEESPPLLCALSSSSTRKCDWWKLLVSFLSITHGSQNQLGSCPFLFHH